MADFSLDEVGTVLAVSDFEASLEFYTKNLGLEPVLMFDDPPFAILGRDSFRLCLAEEGHPADDCPGVVMRTLSEAGTPPVRFVLWVPDCVSAYEELWLRRVCAFSRHRRHHRGAGCDASSLTLMGT